MDGVDAAEHAGGQLRAEGVPHAVLGLLARRLWDEKNDDDWLHAM